MAGYRISLESHNLYANKTVFIHNVNIERFPCEDKPVVSQSI